MTVWLEIGMVVLLLVVLAQSALLVLLWMQARSLRTMVGALGLNTVPTSMLVTALDQLEHRISMLELPPSAVAQPAYDLAQQLAREGADVSQLVDRCDLSPDEASLIVQMHSGGQQPRTPESSGS